MKKLVLFLMITGCVCFAQVNGVREDLDNERMKVRVWGTHYERGYAYGYLLAEESLILFEEYIIGTMFYGSANGYEQAKNIFLSNWNIDEDFLTEFSAAIEGIEAAGVNLYIDALQREIDANDIAMINSIVDISALVRQAGIRMARSRGCSTISSWGESTIDDPLLQGDLLITRHLDWNSGGILDDYSLMLISQPSEEDEQAFISFTYPLFVTGLSAVNESGVVCFMNMGNNNTIVNYGPYNPVLLRMRKAIESVDYNGDDSCDPNDLVSALQESNLAASAIITTVKDNQNDALIIEQNNTGQSVRTIADNATAPVVIGDNIIATNHFRTLYPPVYCNRYASLADQIEGNSDFTAERQWQVLSDEAGQGTWTRMTIQFEPQSNKCLWATTSNQTPAYNTTPTEIDIRAELNGWVNKPYKPQGRVPVFLFMEDGTSDIEAGLIEEFSGYRESMGSNNCLEMHFLSDPDFVIDEYTELTETLSVDEIPYVIINRIDPYPNIQEDYSEFLCDQILKNTYVDLKIMQLDTENNILYFTIETLIDLNDLDILVSYYIWEDNLALNWHSIDLELPAEGEKELYALELDVPDGGWTNRYVNIDFYSSGWFYSVQSASTYEENINPMQAAIYGYREEQMPINANSCTFDTLVVYNTSDITFTCMLEYDLDEFLEEEIVTAKIIRATGEEIVNSAENPGEYQMLPGEYLYLVTELSNLHEYESEWEFVLNISMDSEDYEYSLPFYLSRMTANSEEQITTAHNIFNYPNPFNPKTRFSYNISNTKESDLIIFNLKGQEIKRFEKLKGKGSVIWNAENVASGIYLYKLKGDISAKYHKTLLLK